MSISYAVFCLKKTLGHAVGNILGGPPLTPLFPYTTLFRSRRRTALRTDGGDGRVRFRKVDAGDAGARRGRPRPPRTRTRGARRGAAAGRRPGRVGEIGRAHV